ncbi:CPBP family intramembrane metalloprotease [candidate division TA06 bacterium]|uniref:CPBP family intramembrane metalloprotease n=1 Tax=candidate division TA06 bacterium TaxID=2250710 RepID=A0A933MLT5_UNCT6|nr:CPBP family intramembrane metalloprotease [candidate division TA06 bacterium]
MTKLQNKYSSPAFDFLLAALTLTPALANWLGLWILNDAWLAIVLCCLIFYGGAYWMIRVFRLRSMVAISSRNITKILGWGILTALAAAALVVVLGNIFFTRAISGNMLQVYSQRLAQSQALRYSFWQFFLFVGIIVPLGEELYWRAGLQGLLRLRFSKARTVIVSALLFTIYHLVTVGFLMPGWPGLPLAAAVFLSGLVLAWLTQQTRNIWAAAICHGLGGWGAIIYLVWKYLR